MVEDDAPSPDTFELTTVGIDIGSATSHLMFSRLRLQRLGRYLSSRYLIVERQTLHRSPILLTPYVDGNAIDAQRLDAFVSAAFEAAGLSPADVDTGAVILTGEAARRSNARSIANLFAAYAGKFVCATAGHHLEAVIAAHGSGVVAASRQSGQTILHVDVGGGTSKLAVVRNGEILATAAINVGGRLVAFDHGGRVNRVEPAAQHLAAALGIDARPGRELPPPDRQRLAGSLADALIAAIRGEPVPSVSATLMLTPPLKQKPATIDGVTFSGGVSEYLYGREDRDFGDIARPLAQALGDRIAASALPALLQTPDEGIRATVIGASQFTVQVSGDTILVSTPHRLPLRNVPVLGVRLDHATAVEPVAIRAAIAAAFARAELTEGEHPVALAIDWNGTPSYQALKGLADGIAAGLPGSLRAGHPLLLAFTGDFGRVVGEILRQEVGVSSDVVAIDGIEVSDLDYIDIGEVIHPAGVVPVVVKSLLFGQSAGGRG